MLRSGGGGSCDFAALYAYTSVKEGILIAARLGCATICGNSAKWSSRRIPKSLISKVEDGSLAVHLATGEQKSECLRLLVDISAKKDSDCAGFLKGELVDTVSKL
jgi:hypothetical protein